MDPGRLAGRDRLQNPTRNLAMESLNSLDVGVGEAGVGESEFWVSLYSLFKQSDRLLVIVVLVKLVKSPTAQKNRRLRHFRSVSG